jgi:hypothetical protein
LRGARRRGGGVHAAADQDERANSLRKSRKIFRTSKKIPAASEPD